MSDEEQQAQKTEKSRKPRKPRKHVKQPTRISNSFNEETLNVMRLMCECALKQVPLPMSAVRSPGFRTAYDKTVSMLQRIRDNIAKAEHASKHAVGLGGENLQGGDHAGQDGARDQDGGP